MSSHKYASLPDIDTAPDVYETEDVFPTPDNKGESSDDELPAKSHSRGKTGDAHTKGEELDMRSLMNTDEASKKFKRAEKRHHRPRIQYTYPPSPTSSSGRSSPILSTPAVSLSQRLARLQAELAALEIEISDPSNPLLHKEEGQVEPGDLIRNVVDAKARLDKISKFKDGRGKLVNVVMHESDAEKENRAEKEDDNDASTEGRGDEVKGRGDVRDIAEMDKRVGELEKIIGSSNTALDEMSPLPPPLLPLLTRLNTQFTLLTQPRHIDNISRRLKLLLSDLDRLSSSNGQHQGSGQRRQTGVHPGSSAHPGSPVVPTPPQPTTHQEQLAPILTRLAPLLPHIPHILTRLRTLSMLHTNAAAFQSSIEGLEEEQRKVRAALIELESAVEGVEQSLKDNENVVRNNVKDLEERVDSVWKRVEELKLNQD